MDVELVYLAGFIDGEGSIRIGTNRSSNGERRWYLILSCHQRNPEPLRRLHRRFGGSVRYQAKHKPRPSFEWAITSDMAGRAIAELRPWLLVKADEADLALTFQSLLHHNAGKRAPLTGDEKMRRDMIYRAMRNLKLREYLD